MPDQIDTLKVQDIMTSLPVICTPETTVAEAAHLMWEADCGILPVVDDGDLVGVVTDRDMYIALATRNARAGDLRVGAVATTHVVTCSATDDLHVVLAKMTSSRIRRVPVIGDGGRLLGMVSMNDIVLAGRGGDGLKDAEIVDAMQSVGGHHHMPVAVTAA